MQRRAQARSKPTAVVLFYNYSILSVLSENREFSNENLLFGKQCNPSSKTQTKLSKTLALQIPQV